MKKVGRYLLTPVPVLLGLGIQLLCSYAGGAIYGGIYGAMAAMSGEAVSQAELIDGYAGLIIYILIASQLIALLVFGIWYRKQIKTKVRRSFLEIVHGKTVLWIVLLGIALQIFTSLVLQAAYLFVPDAIDNMSELLETAGVGELNLFSLAATVILAPIAEEIIFRGVTMNLAKKAGASFIVANLIQAVLFGVYHVNLVQGTYAAIVGLVLGYAAHKYGSLYPTVLLHLAYNLAATLLSAAGEYLPDTVLNVVFLAVAAVVLCIPGVYLFKSDKKEAVQEREESQILQGENL